MAISRYDQFLDNDYSFQQYQPQEWQPNLEVMDNALTGLQTEYDTGLGELERIMPNYLRQSDSDTQAAKEFRSKYDNLIAQTTDAFTKGNINEGRRMLNQGLREVEKDQLPGGEYHELQRRVTEFDTEDKKLQTIYLDPKSKQYNPEMYNYYKNQLMEGITPFKDEQGNYNSIQGPDTRRIYTDTEESNMMIGAISKLPANQFAKGPEFASKIEGMTVGDVMSQGLVKHLDSDKISSVLKGVVGQDLQLSSQEKQKAREQEITSFLSETGEFNPSDPLGQRALRFMESFSFSQEQMSHRFIPSNFGGGGYSGRTRSGNDIAVTQTPNVQIVQTPVTTEIKTDNQLAEDGTYLEEEEGFAIYKNTERLFREKTTNLPETLATTLENEQISPETVLDGVFYKYMPDTADEFGSIQDADYYQLPSEVFVEDKYAELQQSFQLADPTVTPEQAKMKADQLIKQADFLYMGINEDVAYYKKAQEKYKERYVAELDPITQELVDWNPQETPITETKYFQETVVESITNPSILGRGDIFRAINLAAKNNAITAEQAAKAKEDVTKYRDKATKKTKLDDSEIALIRKNVEDRITEQYGPAILNNGLRNRSRPAAYIVESLIASDIAEKQKERASTAVRRDITQDEVIQIVASFNALDKKKYETGQLTKYDNETIHSEVSQELLPNLKRSMPVLNYLSQGFDWNSESSDYNKQPAIRQLQIDGRGLRAKINNKGELVEASKFVDSANIFKVTPGQMFEKDGYLFEINKDQSKVMPKEKENIAGITPIGFVKGPDNKIYYYGQTQIVDEKESGNKTKPGDYVYYEYSSEDNLTKKFYNALGSQGNVYEDLHFFNKQLDMEKITNTDNNASVNSYQDSNYFPGRSLEIKRNDTPKGFRYKMYIDGKAINNNNTMSDSQLASALSQLKIAQYSQRGDRNNNPTAFTVALAKQAGLVEGVDYEDTGDVFTSDSGKSYTTAKILKDPVETALKVIDKVGFKRWDDPTEGRWGYITDDPTETNMLYMTNEKWKSMSKEQKIDFIKKMEVREGGSLLNQ